MFFLLKRFMEKKFVIPRVDEHWVTSRYVWEVLREYAEVESMMVNPVLDEVFLRNQELGIRNQKKQPHSWFLIPDSSDKKVMITHGRLVPWKGHSTLFSVYENLRKDFPDLEFWVIWGGELRHEFECQNCDDEHVQFFGQLSSEEIVSKYQSANVAVFASSIDAFGMSALESQALGVDTVVLSKSGARESVVDSEFWYLVCDAQGMEDQIRRVLWWNSQKDKDIQSTHTHVYEPFSLSFFSSFLLNYIEEISK